MSTKTITGGLLVALLCAGANAATVSTTITINGTGGTSGQNLTASGTVTFTGGLAASGTLSSSFSLTDPAVLAGTVPITITVTSGGTTGTLTGTLSASASLLFQVLQGVTTATGPATIAIASGTGGFAGTTGSFTTTATGTGFGTTGSGAGTFTITGPGTLSISGGTSGPPTPAISAVLDAGSNTAGLAQGTIFIVKGSNLCPSGQTFFSIPRPTVSPDGVKITFTPAGGGAGTDAILWYEYNPSGTCQLAGILPSSVAVGNYNVTVTNGSQVSAPAAAQVVASKFALFTQDSTGGGMAVAQQIISATQYDLNRLTSGSLNGVTYSPAHPLQNIVAYGTGIAGLAGQDNTASPLYDFSTHGMTILAVVGGMNIPVQYAGLAGYAGEDQINFQLPASVPTGCAVSFQISVNGVLSPATTMSIAPANSTAACVLTGYTTAQLSALDQGGTITTGTFSITQSAFNVPGTGVVKSDSASGSFTKVTGFELASLASLGSFSQNQIGQCTVTQQTLNNNGQVAASGGVTYLDAGNVTLSGPSATKLSSTPMTKAENVVQGVDEGPSYSLSIGTEGFNIPGGLNGTIVAGTYTLAGAGGSGVNNFSTSITLGAPLTINGGLPSAVNRSQPLALTWTGGNSTDVVTIYGYSGSTTGSGANQVSTVTSFTCTTTAGTGGFTVPTSVLGQLQATPASAAGGTGILEVSSGPTPVSFTPALAAGGTIASTLSATIGTGAQVIYQ